MKLKLLDIKDVPIFNLILSYKGRRDYKTLSTHSVIRLISPKDKNKVIKSLLLPSEEIKKLHKSINNKQLTSEFVGLLIELFNKIKEKSNPEKIIFISILRSGFPVATLLQYIFYKNFGVKISIAALTPNFIETIDKKAFKKFIKKHDKKDIYFLDGWISTGTTYKIVKKLWNELFQNKKFNFGVISNISSLKNKELIFSTSQDVLLPWNIALTDNVGLSNFFVHPQKNAATSFYIPKKLRKINNEEFYLRSIIDKNNHLEKQLILINDNQNVAQKNQIILGDKIKVGINECIKSLEKGNVVKLFVSPNINKEHLCVLKKYSQLNNLEIKFVNNLKNKNYHCKVVRK